ncbi:MAG: FtsX-like permease family protein [Pseudoflavonifractor sp.]|nr:FtsX-like permease family protein [Pseudoflavonifractor sp.]
MLNQESSNLNYSLLKDQHMVILTQNVADNLNLSVGDQIFIKLHVNGNDSGQYTVGQIIKPIYGVNVANTDLELSENILGTIYMAAPETSVYNTAFINVSDPNSISRIESILQSHLGDQFNVRTKSELWELTKGLIMLQLKGLDFIGIVSCIISGIGICFAFIHLIMKRQKDFVVFRVMGMRRGMLSELLLTEILGMGIPASAIGIPLGIILTHFLLSTNGGFMGNVNDAIRQCVFVLIISVLSLIAFSMIPIYISGTISPNAIFRGGKIKIGSKLKMSWPIFIVMLFLSVIFSLYAKSPIGALFVVILFVLESLVYLIMSLMLLNFLTSYSKFYLTPAMLTSYNHESVDDLIKARYYTGGLALKFQKYCNNLVVYAYDLDTSNEIPVDQGRSFLASDKGKNKVVISSDFLKSVVEFKSHSILTAVRWSLR